jgi:GT2 family glycosyltransferase
MRHMPTGCLLVRMSVFDALAKPHFRFLFDESSGAIVGEDYNFCDRARAVGFRIWCDPQLSFAIGHIGQQICRLTTTAPSGSP